MAYRTGGTRRARCAGVDGCTTRRRDIHSIDARELRYRWHPWHGQRVWIWRSQNATGCLFFSVARLDGVGLAFFRVEQQQVTATSSEFDGHTARWCEAFYRADPTLDGLLWISHRATPARAYVFFGTTVMPTDLALVHGPAPLLSDASTWRALKDTASAIRVRIPEFAGVPP